MEYKQVLGFSFSRLMLGTVALGMEYGVANRTGQPGPEATREILAAAVEAGINVFDTARTYGSAEERLGQFFSGKLHPVEVVTKFKISPENIARPADARAEAIGSVRESVRRLGLERVAICLLHMDHDLPMDRVRKLLPPIFRELKEEGLIREGGVSIDHPDEVLPFLEDAEIHALQVPINVFDQRLIGSGLIRQLKAANRAVFARSVFLQGLFFVDPEQLSGNLRPAAGLLRELRGIANDAGMSVAQLAFSYIRDMDGISCMVFGAESAEQVRQTAVLQGGAQISAAIRDRIEAVFGVLPMEIITPRLWRA